ncbi:hypothetical protein AGABI1DRAFT_121418 [Agaricus bisporus var. burnettii JB137-S8]|uniref:Glycoside hydrolase family 31 N-terminal domain-containing protein n=1 Tax=Agaricus bisporus var. burnettii (strain JB137-S8 / ATCC MYA-4627 / FGSC 10392) TaxID=597362 RepID=K5X537_AGABU|nr:uncharacterized protein AGABI1DRAFT_121418 [Agaricus bisporus var. burnettii JB137-S8]EKM78298.1 hypothetical protein AGABI1DRAFT_121418 [Agaricus bisporus var. burnettii JB137-S8]
MVLQSLILCYLVLPISLSLAADYFNPNATGIKLQNGFERIHIQPFGNHGFRVRASLLRDPTGREPSALIDPPLEGPSSKGLEHSITIPFRGNATVRNGNLVVDVSFGVTSFSRVEPNGTLTLLTSEYADTKVLPARYYVQDIHGQSFQAQFGFSADPDEMFFGTGQHACCKDHTVNKKGQIVDLINYNSHVTLPIWMSNKGYLMFFNYPGQGRIEFDRLRTRFVADEATVVDYWITTAPPEDYDALQQQFTGVTGRQPTPPDFSLGFQQSKLRYYNQTQIIDLAQRFHDEQVPISLIVIDFFAWKFQGDWSLDVDVWPDPTAMAAEVKRLTGAELMVSLWPSVEDLSENYLTLQEEGLLAITRDGTGIQDSFEGVYTRLIDSTNPDAREFLWKRLNDSYFSKGIHNFWIDQADGGTLGEPFENNGQSISSIPYSRSFTQYFLGSQEGFGKMYPWLHQQAIQEGFQNLTGTDSSQESCEYMSLTRSTFIGGQRFCSYLWSGDTDSKFDVLLQQITAGVSVAASGISSWTLDIGGFAGLDIDTDEGKELFVRWFSMGVFLPYTRVHGTRSCNIPRTSTLPHANPCPNEPWSYGEDNFVILKKYIALRYQLIPYVKTLFQMLHTSGKVILRPLYFDFSKSDEFVRKGTKTNDPVVVHQFMFGPRLLVAPVGEFGVKTWDVYLPKLDTQTWKHWQVTTNQIPRWTDHDFGKGGMSITIDAPLDQIPVFYLGDKDDILNGNI